MTNAAMARANMSVHEFTLQWRTLHPNNDEDHPILTSGNLARSRCLEHRPAVRSRYAWTTSQPRRCRSPNSLPWMTYVLRSAVSAFPNTCGIQMSIRTFGAVVRRPGTGCCLTNDVDGNVPEYHVDRPQSVVASAHGSS